MLQHLSTWLNALPIDDPMDRRQAISLQVIILVVLAVGIVGLPISYDNPDGLPRMLSLFANLLVLLFAIVALILLHRGMYRSAVGVIAGAILLGASFNLVISGFAHIRGLVLIFALPLALASLLIGRKALLVAALITIIIFVNVAVLELSKSPLVGFLPEGPQHISSTVAALMLSIGLVGLFLDQFSATWRHALNDLKQMNGRLQIELRERQKIEDALRESEARYRVIAENSTDLIGIVNVIGCFVYVSPSFGVVLGYPPQHLVGKSAWNGVHPEDLPEVLATWEQVLEQQHSTTTYRVRSSTDEWFWFETQNTVAIWNDEPVVVIVGRNITERRRLEAQLLQAQKMEGIGRLAGGIAHDFNNLLVVIDGYTDLVIESLPANTLANTMVLEDLQEVQKATNRAANLTRQLLAFARRQINDPQVISISNMITDMDMLLRRLIREDIELIINAPADLWPVRMDATQAEQVIVNLVVNARDAMPNGGQLVIELANVALEQEYLQHIAITPGHYVIITISDTGVGMDAEVQRHIFEPFFTTKEIGHGTGLGLATCYGIIKQNNGTIWVYSELGQGTTIKIYLPRAEGFAQNIIHREQHSAIPSGNETILLVEDELAVRELIARVLRGHGYRVAEAATGEEALAITKNIGVSAIDLLLTDVVMPKMGGRVLADRIIQEHPAIRVLYTSGYTDTAIVTHGGQLNPGTALLQKPFTSATLAYKVREVLDA